MLSQLRIHSMAPASFAQVEKNASDDKWSRNMQDDMKEAIDLLFKFRRDLDKLHPECMQIIENMLQRNHPRY
jgi:hypothetical protein